MQGRRAVDKIEHPILLAFCSAFFVAMKLTYLDMLASSRLECGNKILRHLGYFIFSTALSSEAVVALPRSAYNAADERIRPVRLMGLSPILSCCHIHL